MPYLSTWKFILKELESSKPVILLYVVDSKGSSPGRQGFMMAVTKSKISGSIGGGIMEYKFVEMAREKLKELKKVTMIKQQFHNKFVPKNQSGMICSGEQTILLFNLSNKNENAIRKIINTLSKNKSGILKISPDKLIFGQDDNAANSKEFLFNSDVDWIYTEKLGYKNRLYIVGGGHCALAFSRLMQPMDFYTTLIEERNFLNTVKENLFIHEKKFVKSYSELNKLIQESEQSWVVIMTFGYRTDDTALRSIIHKKLKYLGVLGSKSKIQKLFKEWRKDNLPEEKLKSIHAPIGIQINSRTPNEIAVSIAAEIIKIKNA
jgi:xanthine dehydrogenase accessory factor